MTRFLPIILALLLLCQPAWADSAAQLQERIDSNTQYTIPSGVHKFEKSVWIRSGKKIYSHEDAIVSIPVGSDYPAFYVSDSTGVTADLPRIEHGGGKTGNSTIVALYRSKDVVLRGGPLIGGWGAVYAVDCERLTLDGLETRSCMNGHGIDLSRCKNPVLRNVKAIGHKSDGVRFNAHNLEPEIDGGEYRDNGSQLAGGGIIGVGIHLSQSWHPRIRNRPIVANNLGNGICWKSSYSPNDYGTPSDLRIDGLILDGNGGNQIEVRWNYFTAGTVRPKGVSIKNVVVKNCNENGIYLDADEVQVSDCVFQDCNHLIVRDGKPLQWASAIGVVNMPDFKHTNCEFYRSPQEVAFYKVAR